MNDTFSSYHPIINFCFFFAVIASSMFFMHPAFLMISVVTAFIYSIYLNGRIALRFNLIFLLPSMIVVSLINPLFNHRGLTILFYFRDNPITLESIYYGIAAGLMFASVILWFSCYNAVMTSDKFIYLFGRIIPASSLIFSMVLRFVPKFKAQIVQISNAQKCIGRDAGSGKLLHRAHYGIKILSIMLTWALENAVETADSMKSRGYGLKGRTSFSTFRFDTRDKGILMIMLGAMIAVIVGAGFGYCSVQYFPSIRVAEINGFSIFVLSVYAVFCFLPISMNLMEAIKWKRLR